MTKVKIILLFLLKVFALSAHSQLPTSEVESRLNTLSENYMANNVAVKFNYYMKEDSQFIKISECELYRKDLVERVVFKEYETYVAPNIYVKVDHEAKQFKILKSIVNQEVQKQLKVMPGLQKETLSDEGLYIDSVSTSIESGKIVLLGTAESLYSKVEYEFELEKNRIISYTVWFSDRSDHDIKSSRIVFEYLNLSESELKHQINSNYYYSEKNNQLIVSPQFENYRIVKNF